MMLKKVSGPYKCSKISISYFWLQTVPFGRASLSSTCWSVVLAEYKCPHGAVQPRNRQGNGLKIMPSVPSIWSAFVVLKIPKFKLKSTKQYIEIPNLSKFNKVQSNINDTGGQTCNFVSSLSKRSVEWLWPRHGVWSCCDRQECHAVKWEPDPRATDADRISILADLQLLKTYDRTSDSKSCVAKLAMLATGSFYLVHLKVPVCQHQQFGRFKLNTRLVIKSDFNENSWNFETRLWGGLGSNSPTPFLASWILASIRAEQRVEVVMRCWTTQFAEPLWATHGLCIIQNKTHHICGFSCFWTPRCDRSMIWCKRVFMQIYMHKSSLQVLTAMTCRAGFFANVTSPPVWTMSRHCQLHNRFVNPNGFPMVWMLHAATTLNVHATQRLGMGQNWIQAIFAQHISCFPIHICCPRTHENLTFSTPFLVCLREARANTWLHVSVASWTSCDVPTSSFSMVPKHVQWKINSDRPELTIPWSSPVLSSSISNSRDTRNHPS